MQRVPRPEPVKQRVKLLSRLGQQATVVISGRNARRVIVGALNVATSALVRVVLERSRGEDIAAGLAAFGAAEPAKPRLLIGDHAPPHQAKGARQAAEQKGLELTKLPYRSPELNPAETGGSGHSGLRLGRRADRAGAGVSRQPLGRRPPPLRRSALVKIRLAIYLGGYRRKPAQISRKSWENRADSIPKNGFKTASFRPFFQP